MTAAAAATNAIGWKVSTSQSKRSDWGTPPAIYHALDKEFDFTVDVAASPENAKHVKYVTLDVDALRMPWYGRVFCNPPYGRKLADWVKKARLECLERETIVVMLLPARTGNRWFHDYVLPFAEIRFIQGRLSYTLKKGNAVKHGRSPFDSMVCIYRPGQSEGNGVRQLLMPFLSRVRA